MPSTRIIWVAAVLCLLACDTAPDTHPAMHAPELPALGAAPQLGSRTRSPHFDRKETAAASPERPAAAELLAAGIGELPAEAPAPDQPPAPLDEVPPVDEIPEEPTPEEVVEPAPPVHVTPGALRTQLAGDLAADEHARVERGQLALSMRVEALELRNAQGELLQTHAPAAALADARGDEVTYAGAFPGAALRFITAGDQLRQELLLESPPAILGGTLVLRERMQLPAGAGIIHWTPAGALIHSAALSLTRTGAAIGIGPAHAVTTAPWFVIPAPHAVDAAGQRVELEAEVALASDGSARYDTLVPTAWLADPVRRYPVRVDPPVMLGSSVPFIATGSLLPVSPGIADLALTIQDGDFSSSDGSVTVTVDWDDGTVEQIRPAGVGARRLLHRWAGPCSDEPCNVRITLADALGRSSVEVFSFARGDSRQQCDYSCGADQDTVPLRSFASVSASCEACEAEAAARCGDPGTAWQRCAAISRSECGNGVVEGGEVCDEGGQSATCDFDCTRPECGDGISNFEAGEECDDAGPSALCRADCVAILCGDGILDPSGVEECDEGDAVENSATCDPDCSFVVCGDGLPNSAAGEACDEGGDTQDCDGDCSFPECGDGYVNAAAGEECDGAGETADCNRDCTTARCGDGIVNETAGETCDVEANTQTCDTDCTGAACGDGLLNTAAGEICDDGGASASCDADCTPAECGDGVVNPAAGEACDDGGESATCTAGCEVIGAPSSPPPVREKPAFCGDGIVQADAGETCDDQGPSADCDADCSAAECGDGVVNGAAGEDCDAGGVETSTCDLDCTAAECGDGVVNTAALEECDGGGDCTAECRCASCATTCGNGTLEGFEVCDDANSDNNDGCKNNCQPNICGDGFVLRSSSTSQSDHRSAQLRPFEGYIVELNVGVGGRVADVDLHLEYGKTGGSCAAPTGDCSALDAMRFVLRSPEGTAVELIDGASWSGCESVLGVEGHFDDEAPAPAPGGAPSDGHFQPAEPLSAFDGEAATGRWVLQVSVPGGDAVLCYESAELVITLAGEECDDDSDSCRDDCTRRHYCGDGEVMPLGAPQRFDALSDVTLPYALAFEPEVDLPVAAVEASVVFDTTGGSCDSPTGGCADNANAEMSVSVTGGEAAALALPGTWSGCDATSGVAASFADDAATAPPAGVPQAGDWRPRQPLVQLTGRQGNESWFVATRNLGGSGDICLESAELQLTFGEHCDDAGESATCNANCAPAVCGDGVVNFRAGEECDDGAPSDTCGADCLRRGCGDGEVDADEDCDSGLVDTADCDSDCTLPVCGDGRVNAAAGEECDEGGAQTAECESDCRRPRCGDGVVNAAAGEACDGGGEHTASCNADCTPAECGDGLVNSAAGEQCDSGGVQTASCEANCRRPRCRDGIVNRDAGESCDPGAIFFRSFCDPDCTFASCGDGLRNPAAGEQCDDGNDDNLDSCDNRCREVDFPVSCKALKQRDRRARSGAYYIDPDGDFQPTRVYCDMQTDGGGWTLVMASRRSVQDRRAAETPQLHSLSPSSSTRDQGLWGGMRSLITSRSDIRFSCSRRGNSDFDVDLSFYDTGWYRDLTASTLEWRTCFESGDRAAGSTPARRNNRLGRALPASDTWNQGRLIGERRCFDQGSFTVDFDEGGIHGSNTTNPYGDSTRWGMRNGSRFCGFPASSTSTYFIWVRE